MTGDHILLFGFAALAALSVVGVFALLLRAVEEIVEKAMEQNEQPPRVASRGLETQRKET